MPRRSTSSITSLSGSASTPDSPASMHSALQGFRALRGQHKGQAAIHRCRQLALGHRQASGPSLLPPDQGHLRRHRPIPLQLRCGGRDPGYLRYASRGRADSDPTDLRVDEKRQAEAGPWRATGDLWVTGRLGRSPSSLHIFLHHMLLIFIQTECIAFFRKWLYIFTSSMVHMLLSHLLHSSLFTFHEVPMLSLFLVLCSS